MSVMDAVVAAKLHLEQHGGLVNFDFPRDIVADAAGKGHIVDELDYTRASETLMVDASGVYHTFPPNAVAQTNLGMKVSPVITNLIPSTGLQGAVVGEVTNGGVGRLPTGWGYQANWVDQVFVVAIGSENGLPTIDIRIVLTAVGDTKYPYIYMGHPTVGAAGEAYTASLYRKTIGDKPDVSNGSSVPLQVAESSTIDGSISHSVIQSFNDETDELTRYDTTYTLTKTGDIEQLIRSFYATVLDGESIDTTIRFAAPQLEIGSYANDPVMTGEGVTGTSAAINVSDDISEFKLTQLSLYTEFNLLSFGEIQGSIILEFSGANSNLISFRRLDASDNIAYIDVEQNAEFSFFPTHIPISTGNLKTLLTISDGKVKIFINGVLAGTQLLPRLSRDTDYAQINFGSSHHNNAEQIIANFKKSVLYGIALDDAICVELTT
ncbi:MAG: hypothetical protein COB24_08775 [Hyphomicrobiales bacterium]|nr:MAG: hypothetical protein COB24_08775 [Hyphomicrobiales bacterium]